MRAAPSHHLASTTSYTTHIPVEGIWQSAAMHKSTLACRSAVVKHALAHALLTKSMRAPGAQTLRSCGSASRMDPPGLGFGAAAGPGLGLTSGAGLANRNMALSSSSVGASSLSCGTGRVPSVGGETLA